MEVMINLEGVKARAIADVVAGALGDGAAVKYLPRPFLGYVIGSGADSVTARTPWEEVASNFVFVSCQGKMVIPDAVVGSSWYYAISDGIRDGGFSCEVTVPAAEDIPADGTAFAPAAGECFIPIVEGEQVVLPYVLAGNTRENFLNLVDSKRGLICAALGVEDIPVYEDSWQMYFPWGSDADAVRVLVEKMIAYARSVKRVSPVEHPAPNKKYAFRCFMLRLGFIGKEYGAVRKVLMSKLTGSSAWLHGGPQKGGVVNE